jgi:hypothetical protein
MTDIEITNWRESYHEIGNWLEEHMPNPPLPDPQRWTLSNASTGHRWGISFTNDKDATLFSLRWA